ncbi:unnamed protein product [Macrosiphum euphorbiae]|uniref:Uncharacterized protein n=1 Tax=Macrosiphum euphorbiae TaxID=13131 RepID=A0AAV0Y969_9HEMI|nr:unnamed protein product [Macrosiphum euphorbiae]
MNAPIPSQIVPAVSEINPDGSFSESILPSITTQNHEYSSNVPYYKPTQFVSGPLYPSPHHSNYLNHHQFPIHSQTRLTTSLPQPQSPTMHFNTISPSASSSTTMDNQAYSEEDSIEIFRDGPKAC